MEYPLPKDFTDRMERLLQNEFIDFVDALTDKPSQTTIRLNPFKLPYSIGDDAIPVPWCPNAYYLPQRPNFTADPLLHAGVYYVQEASSMFIAEVLKQHCPLDKAVMALDLCAAPGGKSTLLSATLSPDSLIIANEVIKTRTPILLENVLKWGLPNTWVTSNDPADFVPFNGLFDVVLIDAPCSGEGLFRKSPNAINEWSNNNVLHCSARQRRILSNAANLVKQGGILIYSTCTFSEEENENNIEWLVAEHDFVSLALKLDPKWGITETFRTNPNQYGYRFYPHKVLGEGFFVSCLQKRGKTPTGHYKPVTQPFSKTDKQIVPLLGKWLNTPEAFTFYSKKNTDIFAVNPTHAQLLPLLATNLIVKSAGIPMGSVKGKELIPHQGLALSTQLNDEIPRLPLTYPDAIQYLKKQSFELPISNAMGWVAPSYQDHPLGWIKLMPDRYNNYYPSEWRIRK